MINWDRFDEYAEEEKKKKLLRIKKSNERRNGKKLYSQKKTSSTTTGDGNRSSSNDNSDNEEKLYDTTSNNSNNNTSTDNSHSDTENEQENRQKHRQAERKKRKLQKQSQHKHIEIHEGGTNSTIYSNTNINSPIYKPLNEKEFVKKLEKFGYNSGAMDPVESRGLPRIGTYAYDPQTGRYIIHKGNNRWVGVHDNSFIVQYEMPAKAIAYDEAKAAEQDNSSGDETASAKNTTTVTTKNITSKAKLDRFGDRSFVNIQPRVQHHRSGAVTVLNPSLLNKKSQFLRQHRSIFLDNFTHHNLSEYSGLLNSTYFDLTIHAKGLAHGYPLLENSITGSSGIEDDDASDFNFIQSNQPSSIYNKGKKSNQNGFVQSFLTDAASSLAHSHIVSKNYPGNTNSQSVAEQSDGGGFGLNSKSVVTMYGSNVRYTTEGFPIRGARKPYTGQIQLLQGVTNQQHSSITAYDLITDSYKGSQNSRINQNNSYKFSKNNKNKVINSLNNNNIQESTTEGSWRTSAWGKLKHGVENFVHAAAKDPTLKNKLYNAVTNPSQNYNNNIYNDQQLEVELENNNEEIDSDEEMWRSRSIYKVNKNEAVKIGSVYPRKPQINYKLRYTWIPQPLVHNAVNNLYYQKTLWDYRNQLNNNDNNIDFRKEIQEKKERFQKKREKQSMLSIINEKKPTLDMDYNNEEDSLMQFSKEGGYSPYRENNPYGGSAKAGYISPSASSVASSKYYKHFIDNNQSPSNVSMNGRSNRVNGNIGSGVMITALMDDNSSVGSVSAEENDPMHDQMGDQVNTGVDSAAEIEAEQHRLLKKGSNLSYTLLREDGQSAQYNVHSPTGSWVSSPQHSLHGSLQGSPVAHRKELQVETEDTEPSKASIYEFPSPLPSYNDLQQPGMYTGLQTQSGWSSPGASISISQPVVPEGGVISPSQYSNSGAWDATTETPTGSFYSPKGTSKASSLKISSQQKATDDTEFTQSFKENYHAERPVGLTKQTSKKVYFIDNDNTNTDSSDHALQLQSNHYLNKKQRDPISGTQSSSSEKSPHLVLQAPAPPQSTFTKTGVYAPKFKFKPEVERTHSFNAEEALAAVTFTRTPKNLSISNTTSNTTGSSKYSNSNKPPPPTGPPPNTSAKSSQPSELLVNVSAKSSRTSELLVGGNVSSKSARASSPPKMTSINEGSTKLRKQEGSAKRLGKKDTIHPYHFA